MTRPLQIHRFDAAGAWAIQDELFALYKAVYADHLSHSFYDSERFAERFAGHSARPGFTLITGRVGPELVGYAYGVPLSGQTRWWEGLLGEFPLGMTTEDGRRTFAVNEIMVTSVWRRRGFARTLHDTLLDERPERRATLLVDPGNDPARSAYLRWGWKCFGRLHPYPDAPVYDVLLKDLGRPRGGTS